MRSNLSTAILAVALAGGCAQTGTPGGSPEATAQAQCQYFAREEGFEWVQNTSTSAASDGTGVQMRLKDAMGRPFDATCIYAGGKKRWAAPPPDNAIRRWEGKDSIAPVKR
jgi:hypothetical protein